uniref:GAF domain-containing protein n=1 Tax=Ditylum brightwellii TaxID=49249 RepID=A0A6V2M1H0_9STRA
MMTRRIMTINSFKIMTMVTKTQQHKRKYYTLFSRFSTICTRDEEEKAVVLSPSPSVMPVKRIAPSPCYFDTTNAQQQQQQQQKQKRCFSSSSGGGSNNNSGNEKNKNEDDKKQYNSANNDDEDKEEFSAPTNVSSKSEEDEDDEEEETIPEPSKHDLKLVALGQSIPFVGFGIMDNAILILAGDAIDTSLGVALGISTLCAAAIGNIISDLAGVLLGTAVEDMVAKLNIPTPNLTAAQRTLRSVRFAGQAGCAVGLTIGCIIGMFPLLFLDTNKVQKQKKDAHMNAIFRDIMTEAKHLIGCEQTRLFLVVDSPKSTTLKHSSSSENTTASSSSEATFTTKKPKTLADSYLYCKYIDDDDHNKNKSLYLPVGKGIVSRAVLTGDVVNIYDARTEPDFVPEENILHNEDDNAKSVTNHGIKSTICIPVFDVHGNVIAVIQALNKVCEGYIAKHQQQRVGSKRRGECILTDDVEDIWACLSVLL